MKKQSPLALLGLCVLAAAAVPQGNTNDLEARVKSLEHELADERGRNEEARELLVQTVAYLHAHAKAGEGVLGTLTESEKLGFTAGINFRSREVLLDGLRGYYASLEEDLPAVPKQETPEEVGVQQGQRRR